MYAIELHDDDMNNSARGSRVAQIGRGGTIDYAYQVEMWLQDPDILSERWYRAYLKTENRIEVVWTRNPDTDEMHYLARAPHYTGEWILPFVETPDAKVSVVTWGNNISTDEEAFWWASAELGIGAITAIVLDREGNIRFAWEIVDDVVRLIACGPATP